MAQSHRHAAADREPLAGAYAGERRRVILGRVRWAARIGFVPIVLSAAGNAAVLGGHELAIHLATLVVQAALCALVLVLARGPAAERRAVGLALFLVLGMGTSLFWSLSLAADDLDVLVGPIACILMGSTLAFPWGVRPQLLVSVYTAAGYLLLPPWPTLDAMRTFNVHLSLGLGLATSVIGAWVLDRQRRATFVERERVGALAREGELLVGVGRELNATLELQELVERITDHGRILVAADTAALTLLDAAAGVARTAALAPRPAASLEPEIPLEFPLAEVAPFLEQIDARGSAVQLPGDEALAPVHAVNRGFGFERTLYVPIRREGRLLGMIAFLRRGGLPAFTAHQVRLAEGLAHQAAIALDNARLVADLQHASRAKSEFVSTMSHELRTPLHVIMGYADMLEDLPPAERSDALARIRDAGRELLDLIEATLDLNRIEAHRDVPLLAPVDLGRLWEELAAEFAALPRRGAAVLRWQPIEGGTPVTDRRKLKIILKNLVANALKFTPAGEIVVRCTVADATCRIVVRDTGVGIAPEHLSVIFDMFRQVDSSDSRSYGGAGLGLYIVRRLAEQLGGSVQVESHPGAGSTFSVTLPSATAAPADATRRTAA